MMVIFLWIILILFILVSVIVIVDLVIVFIGELISGIVVLICWVICVEILMLDGIILL